MKAKILLFVFFFGLNQLMAQSKNKPPFYKQPNGYAYIPQKGNMPGFYVMKEPVTKTAFNEYLNNLYVKNNFIEVNTNKSAITNDHYRDTKYLILSNPTPIELYAAYLSYKMSDSITIVRVFPISESMWKQMKAPAYTKNASTKNPYGLIFFSEVYEYKVNSKGTLFAPKDNNGYERATFRLALSYIPRQTSIKK
ncbi:MAG: hypothetical protein SGJ00_14825 [bacterium]|nr:hypothetical protein [bacterium]